MTLHPVILAGGSGTRLWPLSRESAPKQFLPLLESASPYQATLDRVAGIAGIQPATIVTHRDHRDLVRAQAAARNRRLRRIYLEPMGRSTAPALGIVACDLAREDPEALLLALPADHDIPDAASFTEAVLRGVDAARAGHLVVFGVRPRWAETGYGYMEQGEALEGMAGCHRVASFVEKPELEIAERLAASGRHYWNSGIFLFSAAAYLAELERLEPELAADCSAAAASSAEEGDCRALDPAAFGRLRAMSVDFAVLERTHLAAMVAADFRWSDIGSWDALWDRAPKDDHRNATRGEVRLHDVSGCCIHSEHRLVVGIGLRDTVVVETPDAILIAARGETQHVREAVEQLRAEHRPESQAPMRVERPWGRFDDIDRGERFRVKRITVVPGGKLSLQYHHHRAEHWIVVRGTARVTCGEEVKLLTENQTLFIAPGVVHRMENPGKVALEIIEVQVGTYLGEDDIVRLEDAYHRAGQPAA